MNNYINIGGVPDEGKSRAYSSLAGFTRRADNPYINTVEVKQKKPDPLIYEWQVMDDKPEKSLNEEDVNLYVADWQMTSF